MHPELNRVSDGNRAGRKSRWLLLALSGLGVSLAGLPAYMATMDVPILRSSGLAAFTLMGLGSLMSLTAARRNRSIMIRCAAGFNVGFLLLGIAAFWVAGALPQPAQPSIELQRAPVFELPDHNNQLVSLRSALESGPVLLVTFRGHW